MSDLTKEAIFSLVQSSLIELFEVNKADIKLESKLYEELDLDSLDAVDLVVHLQKLTGKKIKANEFKLVRTVGNCPTRLPFCNLLRPE